MNREMKAYKQRLWHLSKQRNKETSTPENQKQQRKTFRRRRQLKVSD